MDGEEVAGTVASGSWGKARPLSIWGHLLVVVFYACLSAVVTWPLALHLTDQMMAEHYYDRAQNIWNIWWVKVALLDQHTNPYHTDLLLHPQGIDLYFHALNLPSGLITMVPFSLFGLITAYNLSAFLALILSGYAGFRLVYYLTGSVAGGLVGGTIIGFNGFNLFTSLIMRAQINLANTQWLVLCVEFFLRSVSGGRRRDALLAGLFFSLAMLTVAYFEICLLLFFVVFGVWMLASMAGERLVDRIRRVMRQLLPAIIWSGGMALLIILPYALGAWLSLQKGQIAPGSTGDDIRAVLNSADVLSFIMPKRSHWLLGAGAPWWQWADPAIHDNTYLGLATLGLAAFGVWHGRRRSMTWLWLAVGVVGMIMALGPVLQVNHQQTFGTVQVPLLFALLQDLPVFGLARAPERFVTLTYTALGVLGGWGVYVILVRLRHSWRPLALVGIFALLLFEMPLRSQYLEPLVMPASMAALGQNKAPGAVLELPLTSHGKVDAHRMLHQTEHGRPITSAYVSRDVIDPYMEACSPLRVFHDYPETEPDGSQSDIISPTLQSQYLDALLRENGIGFIAVYKQGFFDLNGLSPVQEGRLSALQELAGSLGTQVADDGMATVYQLRPTGGVTGLFMQIGEGWHRLEESYGQPFRWMDGAQADMCLFSPAPHTAPLTLQAASFAAPRHLQVWAGGSQLAEVAVPADGALHPFTTPAIQWPAGPYRLRFIVPEGSESPASLGQGSDRRRLSIGFSTVRLGQEER